MRARILKRLQMLKNGTQLEVCFRTGRRVDIGAPVRVVESSVLDDEETAELHLQVAKILKKLYLRKLKKLDTNQTKE